MQKKMYKHVLTTRSGQPQILTAEKELTKDNRETPDSPYSWSSYSPTNKITCAPDQFIAWTVLEIQVEVPDEEESDD
jgi:hypothetical protein